MKHFLAFMQAVALLSDPEVSAKKCGGKGGGIIGGTKATRGQLPWQILMFNNERSTMCGGSVISSRHVLTAGHCIRNKAGDGKTKPHNLDVYAGVLNINDAYKGNDNPDIQLVPVKAIHVDDKIWDVANSGYELTILTMKSNFTFNDAVNFIRPANKQDPTDLNGQEVIASGWGTIDHYGNDGTTSEDLLWTKMMVSECDVDWTDGDDLFCARGANGENVCSGDSGGPIVCKDTAGKDYLCGFSSGSECEKGQSQLGRVNFYADFIKKTMSKP